MHLLCTVPAAVVCGASTIAAITDVWKFKVYNALTLPLLVSGLAYHGLVAGWSGLGVSVLGGLFGFAVLLIPYAMGGVGAGDVKFLSGVGAWLGVTATINVFMIAALAGGVYGVALMLWSSTLRSTVIRILLLVFRLWSLGPCALRVETDSGVEVEVQRSDRRRRLIPYAAMLALGVGATVGFIM